jgi:hypothetical protein
VYVLASHLEKNFLSRTKMERYGKFGDDDAGDEEGCKVLRPQLRRYSEKRHDRDKRSKEAASGHYNGDNN